MVPGKAVNGLRESINVFRTRYYNTGRRTVESVNLIANENNRISKHLELFNWGTLKSSLSNQNTLDPTLYKNLLHFLLFLNLSYCTGFVVMVSLFRRVNENLLTLKYSAVLFSVEILLLEPVLSLLLAFTFACVRSYVTPDCIMLAQKRAVDADVVIKDISKIQDINYTNRMVYTPQWEYKGKGDMRHKHVMLRLKEMETRHRRQAITDSKRRSTFSLLVFIICAIIVVRVHSNIRSSYMQKRLVYTALGLHDDVIKSIVVTDIWDYVKKYHLPFIHHISSTGRPQYVNVQIYGKIRQVRVRPDKKCKKHMPESLDRLMENNECYQFFDVRNIETRNFGKSWKEVLNDTDSSKSQNISGSEIFGIRTYRRDVTHPFYKPTYSFDGYEYIFKEGYQDNIDVITLMEHTDWLDNYTRAVILDTAIVNINTGIASTLVIIYHFMPNGIKLTHNIESFVFDLEPFHLYLLLAALLGFVVLVLKDIFEYMTNFGTFGFRYFSKQEHVIQLINTVFVVCILVGFGVRFYITLIKQKAFTRHILGTDGPLYISLVDLNILVATINYTSGFLAFGALMRIIEAAGHFDRLRILMNMIRGVFVLSIIPGTSIIALSWLLYVEFGRDTAECSTLPLTFMTTTQFIVSKGYLGIENNKLNQITSVLLWLVFFVVITNGFVVALSHIYTTQTSLNFQKRKGNKSKSILYEMKALLLLTLGLSNLIYDDDGE